MEKASRNRTSRKSEKKSNEIVTEIGIEIEIEIEIEFEKGEEREGVQRQQFEIETETETELREKIYLQETQVRRRFRHFVFIETLTKNTIFPKMKDVSQLISIDVLADL